jgi:hypothetical protein
MHDQIEQIAQLSITEITFALPAQRFGITCAISTEEALPVVTEFALRMTHVCGALMPSQLQCFFGFSDKEVAAVVRTLEAERLVRWQDDHLVLTHYALGIFLDSSESIPRFFKIVDWTGEVVFDLISFSPVKKPDPRRRTNAMVELSPQDPEKESKTLYWAERSFQENFRQIMRRDRVEIYKISDVEAGERFMLPLPCTFSLALDERLGIQRSMDDELLGEQLEIAQAISDALSIPSQRTNDSLAAFAEAFQDPILARYFKNGQFELRTYIEDVHVWKRESYSDRSEPLLGSLHLTRNRRKLADWTTTSTESEEKARHEDPLSACWLIPQTGFWGRSPEVRRVNDEQTRLLRGENKDAVETNDELGEKRKNSGVKAILQCGGLKDTGMYARIHRYSFPKLFGTTTLIFNGQVEIFVVPGRFMCALFHYQTDHSIPIPIGFISATPSRIETAIHLLRNLARDQHGIHSLRNDEACDVNKEFEFLWKERIPVQGTTPENDGHATP